MVFSIKMKLYKFELFDYIQEFESEVLKYDIGLERVMLGKDT